MATDIGIELAVIFDMLRGKEPRTEMNITLSKLLLHALTVLAFIVGGVAGVLLYDWVGGSLLLGISMLLLSISVPQVAKARLATWSG